MIDKRRFAPGTHGCHEALHMAAFLGGAITDELVGHTAIRMNKKWLKLAEKAEKAMWDLYNAIGEEHL